MTETIVLQIIADGVFVVNLTTDDIEEAKTAIHKYEYERDEIIGGRNE